MSEHDDRAALLADLDLALRHCDPDRGGSDFPHDDVSLALGRIASALEGLETSDADALADEIRVGLPGKGPPHYTVRISSALHRALGRARRVTQRLPEPKRTVVPAYGQTMTQSDIAQEIGMERHTLNERIRRAVESAPEGDPYRVLGEARVSRGAIPVEVARGVIAALRNADESALAELEAAKAQARRAKVASGLVDPAQARRRARASWG